MENVNSRTDRESRTLSIVAFIDALGWEVLKGREFLESELGYRKPLRSVFGFSSACVPSILTGQQPEGHGHWSFFYRKQGSSPFEGLRWLRHLPTQITGRSRVRNRLSKLFARQRGYEGYFQLYNVPFDCIDEFDYCEKKDLFKPGGINRGVSIFDRLDSEGVAYHVSDWRASEDANVASLSAAIADQSIRFAFLYMADLDGLLHQVGKDSSKVDAKLRTYEAQLRDIIDTGKAHYDDVRIFVCSDHGMATVHTHINVMERIEALPLRFGEDYLATYDSTMARFWFKTPTARETVTAALADIPQGRVLTQEELSELGCRFEGDQYGELIFLVEPGVIIVPSHMGTKPIAGMHGYHPDDADSDAALLSNVPPPVQAECITDIFHIMTAEAAC